MQSPAQWRVDNRRGIAKAFPVTFDPAGLALPPEPQFRVLGAQFILVVSYPPECLKDGGVLPSV